MISKLDWRIAALIGFSLWGGWALYVNWSAGVVSASISAVTQGCISAASISGLSLGMEYMLNLRLLPPRWRNVAAALVPYSLLLAVIVISHITVGTENVIATILPSASLGLIYSVAYVIKRVTSETAILRPGA